MNNKATGVFWIGFLLIFMNFWLSGQSSTLWKAFTTGGAPGNLLGLLSSNTVNTGGGSGSNLPPLPLPGFPFVPPVTLASATVPGTKKKTGKSSSNPAVNSPIASPGTTGPVVAGPPSNPVAYAQPLGGSGLGPASGTIFTNPNVSPLAWAKAVLTAAKFPQTKANQQSLIAWALNENTTAAYNPLATTLGPGASVFNSKNVWNYNGWPTGIQRTAATIHNGYYPQIVADLTTGKGITPASNANLHTWSGQGYNSITGNWVKAGQYMRQRAPVAPGNPNAYQNPFRAALGLTPQRVDQGVDYANPTKTQLPIYALGPGTIVNLYNSGWPGGAFIAELLSAGPAKGQVVYAAETIKPKVSIGQKVNSDTIIGQIQPGGVGIETGWGGTGAHLGDAAAYFAGQSNYGPGDVGAHPTAYGAAYNNILMRLGAPGGLFYQGNPVPAGQTVPGWASQIFRINKPASHSPLGKHPALGHPGHAPSRIYQLVSFFRAPPKPKAKPYRPVPKRGPGHPTLR
jgi:hypothetical protein